MTVVGIVGLYVRVCGVAGNGWATLEPCFHPLQCFLDVINIQELLFVLKVHCWKHDYCFTVEQTMHGRMPNSTQLCMILISLKLGSLAKPYTPEGYAAVEMGRGCSQVRLYSDNVLKPHGAFKRRHPIERLMCVGALWRGVMLVCVRRGRRMHSTSCRKFG